LYATASVSFLTNVSTDVLDLTTVSGGYRYSTAKLATGAELTRYFFSKSSYNLQSAMTGYGALYAGYNIADIITVYGDAMLSFGSSSDIFTGVELSHPFYLWADRLQVTPTFYSFWGTQRFYNTYYIERQNSMQRPGGGGYGNGPGSGGGTTVSLITTEVAEAAAFRLLSLEWSVPVSVQLNKWRLSFNPVYAVPQSPSVITENGVAYKEALKPVFFWSLALRFQPGF
jgi:hypothetical protein